MQAVAPATPTSLATEAQWTKCPNPSCQAFVYYKRLHRNLKVCPECNYHFMLPVRERLAQLLDPGDTNTVDKTVEPVDVLGFVDMKPYSTRLAESQARTGNREATLYGSATIGGHPIFVAAIDFAFLGGSMGGAVGEAITVAAELALKNRVPLLVISASGGARMQEGSVSLMQMAKTSQALARLHEEGILYLSLLTDPTYGGVSASFATLGDILLAEPAARIGFSGKNIIEQTLRQKLPPNFQTAEFQLDHGMLDLVEPRENLRNVLRKILAFHAASRSAELPRAEGRAMITDGTHLQRRTAWETVELARNIDRPNTLEYIGYIFDDFLELHGDRLFREDAAIVGGLASLGQVTVMVIGQQKGHTTSEMVARNFGMPNPEGYRKALRLMQYAAKFGMPIITLIDTPGAYPGIGAEERGQSVAVARNILEMSRLPVPIVSVVTGEGGSGGALALGVGDRVLMMENAYYSVISPEGCAVILWKSTAAAPTAAAALRITAPDLLRLGIMDGVIPEPDNGAHTDPAATAANLKTAIISSLSELRTLSRSALLENRYARFRRFGTAGSQPLLSEVSEGTA
jgi:acetyl-CoA carboxylase carboxyl transferase alpha subunit